MDQNNLIPNPNNTSLATNVMKLPMTISKYLTNPAGTTATFMSANIIREGFDRRYDKLIKTFKKFNYELLQTNTDYYVLVHVPSESITNLTYEVCVKLKKDLDKTKTSELDIRLFSNSPSFVYNYAYVYNINNLVVEECVNKIEEKALRYDPVQKNYHKIVGFEKSIYYALKFINDFLNPTDFEKAEIFEIEKFKELIDTTTEKLKEYSDKKAVMKSIEKSKPFQTAIKKVARKEAKRQEKLRGIKPVSSQSSIVKKTTGTAKTTGRSKITGKRKIK